MKHIDAEKLLAVLERQNVDKKVIEPLIRIIDSLRQEHLEVELEKFTQRMNDWKARYNHPDNIPIKATMAFTARMFYQYPNVARQWYDNLPKATMD